MKICFVSHSASLTGSERALLELIDGLIEKNVQMCVLLPSKGQLLDELQRRSVKSFVIPYRFWGGGKSPLRRRVLRTLRNSFMLVPIIYIIAKMRSDIVYTNTITVSVGAMAAKLVGKKHVWHIHELDYASHGFNFDLGELFSLKFMDYFTDTFIAVSKAVVEKFSEHIAASKIKQIYQAVSVPELEEKRVIEEANFAKTKFRCILIGSLQSGKRQEDAIGAVAELVAKHLDLELVIVGDGDAAYTEYLKNLVIDNKLNNHVRFTGFINNPFSILRSADVALVCSINESFGRVALEAMLHSKPVIATRSGGTKELIQHGYNGFLYEPKDHKDLAEKINYLYNYPNIGKQLGENGLRWASDRFTKQRYTEEVLAVLNSLV